jgi:hypothetical protein
MTDAEASEETRTHINFYEYSQSQNLPAHMSMEDLQEERVTSIEPHIYKWKELAWKSELRL